MFKANPDRFLQTIPLGSLIFDLNVLAMDAYKGMMSHMGMEGMIKPMRLREKRTIFSVYPTQDHEEIALGDVKLALSGYQYRREDEDGIAEI